MQETRIVIIHKPESDTVSVYINNPNAGKEELFHMLTAHISHYVQNMILRGMQYSDAATIAAHATEVAANRAKENRVAVHPTSAEN